MLDLPGRNNKNEIYILCSEPEPGLSSVKVACDLFFVRDPMTKGDILLQNGLKLGIKIVI